MISGQALFFHDAVDLQDEGTGDIYVRDVFFFQFIIDRFAYTVGTDDYCSVLQGVIRGIQVCFCDNMDATSFQIRYYAFVVDDRAQKQKPAVSATFTFIK